MKYKLLILWAALQSRLKRFGSAFLKIVSDPRKLFFSTLFSGGLVIACVVFMGLGLHLLVRMGVFGPVANAESLGSIQNHNSSEIFASGEELLGKFYILDRSSIGLQEISPDVINALIATEDARFYQHRGTDIRSMVRVVIKNLLMGDRGAGGGSTINRQLTKNLFPRQREGIFGLVVEKFKEGIIARRFEKVYTKDEILELYLNTVPFGDNVFGISAASQRFFNKHPRLLTTEEAASLIGMLKATNSFNPRIHPEKALQRRNVVLGQMRKYNYIDAQQADSLLQLPLTLNYSPMTHIHGPAPYFREMLRISLAGWLEDYNARNQANYNLYTDGLKIFTTIDFDLQLLAEQAVREEMAKLQKVIDKHYRNVKASAIQPLMDREMLRSPRYRNLRKSGLQDAGIRSNFATPVSMQFFNWEQEDLIERSPLDSILRSQTILHSGILSLEPSSGYVKAWVGGNHFRYFQYDHVTSIRQVGSAFKPFVYAAALESGIKPCDFVPNASFTLDEYENWGPNNNDGNYEGYYSMKGAMTHSINTVSTRYLMMTGFEPVTTLAGDAGIASPLPAVPSLALGAGEVSMLDLAAAYCIFANNGEPVVPVFLLRIEDSQGKILFQQAPKQNLAPVITPETALLMTDILRSVVNQGTAGSLRGTYGLQYDIAGKTGTTTNNADGWFVGYTPGLLTAVWTGLENPIFADTYPLPFGASRTAVPLWGNYMAKAGKNPKTKPFTAGTFETLPEELLQQLNCPLFLDELPEPSWMERIFGSPDPWREIPQADPVRKRPERKTGSRLRRWLEENF